jgi:ribonuclease E
MSKRMLIDASHPEETRVVVLDGTRVEEFDFEAATKRPLKGNIYLAKVTRVEPSLQAAFVEYGGNRQGFLAFSEIHPDYYQIPVADRMAILEAQTQRMMAEEDFDAVDIATIPAQEPMLGADHGDEHVHEHAGAEAHGEDEDEAEDTASSEDEADEPAAEEAGAAHDEEALAHAIPASEQPDEAAAHEHAATTALESGVAENSGAEPGGETPAAHEIAGVQAEATGAPASHQRRGPRQNDRPRPPRRRQYKIQEVIKRRQVMLVQVVKEERGNKGASLTTFLSLAGRYCVLMPNTPRGGGISRKITNAVDRKRLKSAAQSLELPEGMGLIIRTAGANRTKLEIKRDYEYLLRLWDTVRELTLKSNAPALVYEEGSLIKRAIRDLYSKDISEVVVDGEAGYRDAKDFMRMLMPSHAKNVKPYKEALPLFQRLQVEAQLDAMFSPVVNLKSGGYIVINQTEALVSIDVNSGKATREHSIEETATKTNLEAADEIGRQLRLRDLAGLIVVDFIDMEDSKNDRNVEKRLHNAVRGDRARIQIGKISQFGLLEMSRQRLRAGVLAGSTVTCPHCNGQGIIRSTESAALRLLRALDEEGQRQPAANVTVKAPADVTIYTLNQKRRELARIEEAYDLAISFDPQASMMGGSFELQRTGVRIPTPRPKAVPVSIEAGFQEEAEAEIEEPETDITIVEAPVEAAPPAESAAEREQGNGEGRGRKRRRRRRGGRGRGHETELHAEGQPMTPGAETPAEHAPSDITEFEPGEPESGVEDAEPEGNTLHAETSPSAPDDANDKRRRRRRRGRRGRRREGEANPLAAAPGSDLPADQQHEEVAVFVPPALETEIGEDRPVVMPNAPSSPLWSLTDHALAEHAPADRLPERRPSLPEAAVQHMQTRNPVFEEAPRPMATHAESLSSEAAAEQPSNAEPGAEESHQPAEIDDTPRELRKGWWQRRFKI